MCQTTLSKMTYYKNLLKKTEPKGAPKTLMPSRGQQKPKKRKTQEEG
jgi:hypothetical protein